MNSNEGMTGGNGNGAVDKRKIILIVGAAAVILAVVLYIALSPKEPVVDPYVVQLEQEVSMYATQIDSLNNVVDGLNGRLNTIRTQMDSSMEANKTLLTSLHRVNNELKEYQRLYKEQQELNKKLVAEVKQLRDEKEQATVAVKSLKSEVDSINNELYQRTVSLTRLESSLEEAVQKARTAEAALTSVLVCVGTEDALEQAGYLDAGRGLFRKSFKLVGFPDVKDAKVLRVSIGDTLPLQGELDAIADRHGKLDKGKEYEVSKGPNGQTLVTFTDNMLQGQRILAVLKKQK